MNRSHLSVSALARTAMMTAILAILAQISLPLPSGVPLTAQTFAIALCGYLLGSKRGCISVGIYLLLGGIGVPVFACFRGGLGILFGVTGGFLFGFIPLAACCGLAAEKRGLQLLAGGLGLIFCHMCGILWFALISHSDIISAFVLISLPYLLKDVISLIVAWLAAGAVQKRLPLTTS